MTTKHMYFYLVQHRHSTSLFTYHYQMATNLTCIS
jgi:hypothetical protein